MEGVERIEVDGKRVRVVFRPNVTSLEAIVNAFYLQGIELVP